MLPIYLIGHPVLRNVSQDISPDYEGLSQLIADMWESMYESDGIGLAAPQIGRNIRMMVIDADPMKEAYPECSGLKTVMINARIEEYGEQEVLEEEGCLSVPGIHERVSRPDRIVISYVDENFLPQRKEFTGFAARVVQHEYDHIEGKLFVDHISGLRKQLIKKKLQKIETGQSRPFYPHVAAPPKRR